MVINNKRLTLEPDTIKFGKVIVWLWIGSIFLAEASSDMTFHLNSRFGKRKEAGAINFQTASRLVRPDPLLANFNQKLSVRAKPHRVDSRFFVAGGRWGKRSGPVLDKYEDSPLKEVLFSMIRERNDIEPKQFMPYEDPPGELE